MVERGSDLQGRILILDLTKSLFMYHDPCLNRCKNMSLSCRVVHNFFDVSVVV